MNSDGNLYFEWLCPEIYIHHLHSTLAEIWSVLCLIKQSRFENKEQIFFHPIQKRKAQTMFGDRG